MAFHLMVAGQQWPKDPQIEEVVYVVGKERTPTFELIRCPKPDDLYELVLAVVRRRDAPVATLDLFDHGRNGRLYMGDRSKGPLFDANDTSEATRKRTQDLGKLLAPGARVRLLGCETALGQNGKKLLSMLPEELGRVGKLAGPVVVYGTLTALDPDDFAEDGFKARREWSMLFSSSEALKLGGGIAPTYDQRSHQRSEWRKDVG